MSDEIKKNANEIFDESSKMNVVCKITMEFDKDHMEQGHFMLRSIHDALVGNQDYIDSEILLHEDELDNLLICEAYFSDKVDWSALPSTLPIDLRRFQCDIPESLLRSPAFHEEERDLDVIEKYADGLVIGIYTKLKKDDCNNDQCEDENHCYSHDLNFQKVNSDYIKPAIKEEIANNPDIDRIRIYREVGTLFKDQGDFKQLDDYTICDEDLEMRNGIKGIPDIDKYGKYITDDKKED